MTARISLVALVLAATLGTAGTVAHADTRISKTGQVRVDLPDTWSVSAPNGDVLLIATDPSKEVGMVFIVVDKSKTTAVMKALSAQLGGAAKHLKLGKPKKTTINGMKGVVQDGSATFDGKPALISIALLKTINGKGLAVFTAVADGTMDAHGPEVLGIFKSLTPVE
jgi:hypothetical protein